MNPFTETPDRDLADRVRARGDEAAFRMLFRRHTPALLDFVLRLAGGGREDAEDIVQETWLAAARGLAKFRWESSLRTWLRAIALNIWRSRLRAREPEWHTLDDRRAQGLVSARVSADDAVDLERALSLLPAGYRTVLLLHDREGYTHDEIGLALGISTGTSKSQLSNARARMRALLGMEGNHT